MNLAIILLSSMLLRTPMENLETLENPYTTNISWSVNLQDLAVFSRGAAETIPEAGYHWPLSQGGTSARYRNDFGPLEKYDSVFQTNLSSQLWKYIKDLETTERLAPWAGYCLGWSLSSVYDLQPGPEPVTVPTSKGNIVFFPEDIKALLAHLWHHGLVTTTQIGSRCQSSHCAGLNPGVWHTMLTNIMGRHQNSFIADPESNDEVWNYPLVNYRIRYFNPTTKITTSTWEKAQSKLPFPGDIYGDLHSERAKSVVGVVMEANFRDHLDHPRASGERTILGMTYRYLLELDESNNIVGGEWISDERPDYIVLLPTPSFRATSLADENLEYSFIKPFSKKHLDQAQFAAQRSQVLAGFVRALVQQSRTQKTEAGK